VTAYVQTTIRCDAERCRAKFPDDGRPMKGDWNWVRAKAAEVGWTARSYQPPADDLCPKHSVENRQPSDEQVERP
jgi:hypothetical protein